MSILKDEELKLIIKEIKLEIQDCFKRLVKYSDNPEDRLMTVDEISEKLTLSKQTIYKLIKSEELKSVKIGKSFYVKQGDFTNYIDSNK